MRLALISYEFAGSAASGGIGTYMRGAAVMMAARGWEVEVFTAEPVAQPPSGVAIHVAPAERGDFSRAVSPVFARRHAARPFDVVEGPDYGADAACVADAFPDLPLVVKLHTPTYLVDELHLAYLSPWRKARFLLGGLRRGRIARPYWRYDPTQDLERNHALTASEVTAPSRSVLDRVGNRWALDRQRLRHVPNVYDPSLGLLDLPTETGTRRVTYLGRIEARKGVIELAGAMKRVLAKEPDTKFRLIGRSLPHPGTREDLTDHIRRLMGPSATAVEFFGPAPHAEVPRLLGETDICVFPSVWEALGFVCLEAMAAGRGVIASGGSGMAEIIDDGRTGRLVPPRDPESLAGAILAMLANPAERIAMGQRARAIVRSAFVSDVIAPMQEASYRRAIERGRPGRDAP